MEKVGGLNEEEIASEDMEKKKGTKEKCGHRKVRKRKRWRNAICWNLFIRQYIEAGFQMERMKIQKKEIFTSC
jgi:hypothetical protein